MIEVTADEWAGFLAPLKVYGTDPGPHPGDAGRLQHRLIRGYDQKQNIISGDIVGEVRYHDNIHKTYWIDKTKVTTEYIK